MSNYNATLQSNNIDLQTILNSINELPCAEYGQFPNGKTWTQSNVTTGIFNCVYNANGIWVLGCNDSGGLYYSITWELN